MDPTTRKSAPSFTASPASSTVCTDLPIQPLGSTRRDVRRHEVIFSELHAVCTHGCSDIGAAADEYRGLWWTRQRHQPPRGGRKSSTRAARMPGVHGNGGTCRGDRRSTDPEIVSRHNHSVSECMNPRQGPHARRLPAVMPRPRTHASTGNRVLPAG